MSENLLIIGFFILGEVGGEAKMGSLVLAPRRMHLYHKKFSHLRFTLLIQLPFFTRESNLVRQGFVSSGFHHYFCNLKIGLDFILQGISVKMLAAGAEHTAAVTESGKLYGWGWGRYGNLGLGDREDRLVPGEVAPVQVFAQGAQFLYRGLCPLFRFPPGSNVALLQGEKMDLVACGWRHTIAVAESGNLYTYGWSKYGQLGHGDHKDHLVPHQVAALKDKRIVQVGVRCSRQLKSIQ